MLYPFAIVRRTLDIRLVKQLCTQASLWNLVSLMTMQETTSCVHARATASFQASPCGSMPDQSVEGACTSSIRCPPAGPLLPPECAPPSSAGLSMGALLLPARPSPLFVLFTDRQIGRWQSLHVIIAPTVHTARVYIHGVQECAPAGAVPSGLHCGPAASDLGNSRGGIPGATRASGQGPRRDGEPIRGGCRVYKSRFEPVQYGGRCRAHTHTHTCARSTPPGCGSSTAATSGHSTRTRAPRTASRRWRGERPALLSKL